MARQTKSHIQVGSQGRIVIPAHLRKELEIRPGEKLFARIENGRLILEKREQIIERWQEKFSSVSPELNIVEDLIAERREEARKEMES